MINYLHIRNIAGVYHIMIILWFVARGADVAGELVEYNMWFIIAGMFL